MDQSGASLFCEVCSITFINLAEKALHGFSKKHHDNLIRLSKNKPINKKQPKQHDPSVSLENASVTLSAETTAASAGITKYGYFVPSQMESQKDQSKAYDYNYDPYLQKLAENPYKQCTQPLTLPQPVVAQTSFSRKKKKRKSCQICNITLGTVPEYEAHMKSPQHAWKLKLSGMGVSAHFVKASTDLHTTDKSEEVEECDSTILPVTAPTVISSATPQSSNCVPSLVSLFCDVCELLLNSEQQYNAHISGKAHNDMVQKKNELKSKKDKLTQPVPGRLFCYSCQLTLNNLFQYNEHRNGKKHTQRCKQLMREGVTIPPEERTCHLPVMRGNLNKPVIYPESYEKHVLQAKENDASPISVTEVINTSSFNCTACNLIFNTENEIKNHCKSESHLNIEKLQKEETSINLHNSGLKQQKQAEKYSNFFVPQNVSTISSFKSDKTGINHSTEVIGVTTLRGESEKDFLCNVCHIVMHCSITRAKEHITSDIHISNVKTTYPSLDATFYNENFTPFCKVCALDFKSVLEYENHINSEGHALQVVKLRLEGNNPNEILLKELLYMVELQADRMGRYFCTTCSVSINNLSEYKQHLSSLVHKFADRENKRKKFVEIKEVVQSNDDGQYTCDVCKTNLENITIYNDHLHTLMHKYTKKALNAKNCKQARLKYRNSIMMRKKRLVLYKAKLERNPGVRTKIAGTATNLSTGVVAPIPNLEPLEPKIDPIKNVDIGVSVKKPKAKPPPNKHEGVESQHGRFKKQPMAHFSPTPPCNWNGHPNSPYGNFRFSGANTNFRSQRYNPYTRYPTHQTHAYSDRRYYNYSQNVGRR